MNVLPRDGVDALFAGQDQVRIAPEYFLFPLGLAYVVFGVARMTILGLMERQEQATASDDQLADAMHPAEAEPDSPLPIERRAGWGDRRGQPEDR